MFSKYLVIFIYYQHCCQMGSKIYPKGVAMNKVSYHSTGLKKGVTSAHIPAKQQKKTTGNAKHKNSGMKS